MLISDPTLRPYYLRAKDRYIILHFQSGLITSIRDEKGKKRRNEYVYFTIKGGSRRAEKSRKVLMMMKAAKLGWAGSGAGQEQTMSRPGAGWEHARSRPGAMEEQGRSKIWAGIEIKMIGRSVLIGRSSQSEK